MEAGHERTVSEQSETRLFTHVQCRRNFEKLSFIF